MFIAALSIIAKTWKQPKCPSRDEQMDTLSLTKEAIIYNGLKTISLTSGAGKSGQPLVKE